VKDTNQFETGVVRHLARGTSRALIAGLAGLALLFATAGPTLASKHQPKRAQAAKAAKAVKKPVPPLRAAILIEADTGTVLSQTKPDMPVYPASLVKMMTLYMAFSALNEGRLTLNQRLPVSAEAERQVPSKLWLKAGESVRVRDLILSLVVRSANDAAVVLAEGLAGSEAAFAEQMTATARRLGMSRTVFRNASGLPNPEQRTTARDMARLALALHQEFPREFNYFSVQEFKFRGETFTGHNRVTRNYDGADGIKTGFTRASGFNLASSVERDGRRLIGVVLGSPSWQVRDRQMVQMLDRGFAALAAIEVARAPDTVLPSTEARKTAGAMARLAAVTSPIGRAQAAPMVKPAVRPAAQTAAAGQRHVQLGAFRARQSAEKVAKAASRLPAAKGKTVRIVKRPSGNRQLYSVQLSSFTEQAARTACANLKKKKWTCFVVRPAAAES
jgi:D-alanyl-D-alanine carboxypeptidase